MENCEPKRFEYAAVKVLFFMSLFLDIYSATDNIIPSTYKRHYNFINKHIFTCIYTVGQKKLHRFIFAITFLNRDPFR